MALVSMRQLLDHAATPDVCQRSIQMGFSSVIKPNSLDAMSQLYLSGALHPKTS